ncbi:MAG: O-antigen ligase family protein [Elusimicrobia bacterium]|nr:O-antigen ligase family protein [Elusimicrobiota bacterium]
MRSWHVLLRPLDIVVLAALVALPVSYGVMPGLTGPFFITILSAASLIVLMMNQSSDRSVAPGLYPVAISLGFYLLIQGYLGTSHSLEQSLSIAAAILYFLALKRYFNQKRRGLISLAILGGGWIAAMSYLAAGFLNSSFDLRSLVLTNKNILALHAVLLAPSALTEYVRSQNGKKRWFYMLIGLTLAAVISTTKSTGAWLALLGSIAVFGWNNRVRPAFFIAGILVLLLKIGQHPVSVTDRLHWLRAALNIWIDHPIFGAAGLGGFPALYPAYKGLGASINSNLSHNLYMEVLSWWGLTGGVLAILFIFLVARSFNAKPPWIFCATMAIAAISGFYESALLLLPNIIMLMAFIAAQMPIKEEIYTGSLKQRSSFFGVWALGVWTLAASLPLTLGRYYLVKGDLLSRIPDASAGRVTQKFLTKASRWDYKNPVVWHDLSRAQHAGADRQALRLARTLVAQKKACSLEPYRKGHWAHLARLYDYSDLP